MPQQRNPVTGAPVDQTPRNPPPTIKGTAKPEVGPDLEKKEDEEWQSTLPPQQRGIGGTRWRSSPEGKAAKDAWRKKRQGRSASDGAAAIAGTKE